jgi:hypothetical protein
MKQTAQIKQHSLNVRINAPHTADKMQLQRPRQQQEETDHQAHYPILIQQQLIMIILTQYIQQMQL